MQIIIIDYNQLMIGAYLATGASKAEYLQEDMVRHMVLNTLRSVVHKNKSQFGKDVYLACDSTNYWRKSIFPLYKASRKKARDKSVIDWGKLFTILNKLRDEIKEVFPYKVILVPNVEADDIIASLCMAHGEVDHRSSPDEPFLKSGAEKPILIVSGDKDFIQLHSFINVKQYSPVLKKFIDNENPEAYLVFHTINGDSDDGIPNILSDDDVFVTENKRQKPIRKPFIEEVTRKILEEGLPPHLVFTDPITLRNWDRNQQLINFKLIPSEILNRIDAEIIREEHKPVQDRGLLFKYLAKNNLRNLLSNVGDF